MSRHFLHTAYAEDQPYSRTILTTHVLHRGFQAGALLGCAGALSHSTYRYFVPGAHIKAIPLTTAATAQPAAAAAAAGTPPATTLLNSKTLLLPKTLRATGLGALGGAALATTAALVPRMWSREEIEWQDRAWRLLENEGQMSVDEWSLGGMVVGAVAAVVAARRGGGGGGDGMIAFRNGNGNGRQSLLVVGAAGLGSLLGVEGSMVWRALRGRGKEEG